MPKNSSTIYEVAHRAGVSIATVSRVQRGSPVVTGPTRERVLRAIDEVGYRPSRLARALAEGRHGASAIVFPDLSGPYYSEVILGYEEEAVAADQSVLIMSTHGRTASPQLVLDLADRVDGMLLFSRTVSDEVVARLRTDGTPVVLLARPVVDVDTVRAENFESAIRLVDHVLGHGHRRTVFIGDPDSSPDAAERWAGFLTAHERAGLPRPEAPVRSSFRETEGYAATVAVLGRVERPTALVCANDEIALGAYAAAQEVGLTIPGDLVVTGWDDIPMARYLSPPLTTVHQPMRSLGVHAARALFEQIRGDRLEPTHVVLPTRLVIRASCGCKTGTGS